MMLALGSPSKPLALVSPRNSWLIDTDHLIRSTFPTEKSMQVTSRNSQANMLILPPFRPDN